MKVAVIGTGIAGMSAAYLLSQHYDITVFEKNAYVGGHSRTILLPKLGDIPVDTGFIVFNYRNYPLLCGLFKHLGVPVQPSNMSFGADIQNGFLSYASHALFAQKRNFFRPAYWRMLIDIIRFNHQAANFEDSKNAISLGDYLIKLGVGAWFKQYYLQAMGAAIWSCSVETILKFPAASFIRFFRNHGLLTVNGHPQWYTVTGGSRAYVEKLTASFHDRILVNTGVAQVIRHAENIEIIDTHGQRHNFDRVIFACHADEALSMIHQPTPAERQVLGSFSYQMNDVVVHSDPSLMPRLKACWASWVYLSESTKDRGPSVSLSYWMNNLQGLKTETPVLVTLNPTRQPDESLVHDRHRFKHPIFDQAAIDAQGQIDLIQNKDRFLFCGAYQRYGFHEDGILSTVRALRHWGIDVPWQT
jgi:predicted NAD/FAD-binding protein